MASDRFTTCPGCLQSVEVEKGRLVLHDTRPFRRLCPWGGREVVLAAPRKEATDG